MTPGDALSTMRQWPDGCADMCVTSPPYWGLRSYSWGGDRKCKHKWSDLDDVLQGCACGARRPRYGIEPTLDEYLAKTVEIFREVRRVLKDWGTLWLNVGDGYSTAGGYAGDDMPSNAAGSLSSKMGQRTCERKTRVKNVKEGQPLMLPERIALALQGDGWILRSKIIWCKAWSFHDCKGTKIVETGIDLFGDPYIDVIVDEPDYVGSCMPESVNGWRWVRHKVKVKAGSVPKRGLQTARGALGEIHNPTALWADCPGCPKCSPNGGYILRQGAWRPTNSWEYMYLFSKSRKYYCDAEAVKETANKYGEITGGGRKCSESGNQYERGEGQNLADWSKLEIPAGRNLRSVWCINPQPFKGAHFATYPEALVEPCIKAGTSQVGNCPKCGMPYARVIDSKQVKRDRPADRTSRHGAGEGVNSCGNMVAGVETATLGWRPTCQCNAGEPVPAVVLDPFGGSGTSFVAAERLGRNWLACEINPEYIQIANKRLADARGGLI